MDTISQIQVNDIVYEICDVTARNSISQTNNAISQINDIFSSHMIRPAGSIPIFFKGGGIYTTSNKRVFMTVPVTNGLINIWDYTPAITITQLTMSIRQNGNYLVGNQDGHATITSSQATMSASQICQNCFTLTVMFNSALGGTNNDTISVDINGSIATLSYTPINE